jgi:hypothetical protein
MKPVKFVRSKGFHRGLYGIRFKELKPYQIRFLEENALIKPHAATDDRYVQVLFKILEYETHHKDHLKLYYNNYTDRITSYEELLEDSKRINWKCSVCRCDIKSEMGNFEIGNFLCGTCIQSHGNPTDVVDDRILDSSIRFREYCRDILLEQQKQYLKYIKVFEKGVKEKHQKGYRT